MKAFLEWFSQIDDKIIYALVFLMTLFPLIKPIGLPLSISHMVQDAFDLVESLPERSPVMFITDITPGNTAEMWPQMVATTRHCMSRNLRLIWFPNSPEAQPFCVRVLEQNAPQYDYAYGEDMVNLPYKAGAETTIVQIGQDIRALFAQDLYGTPLWGMEVMEGIEDAADFKLIIDYTGGEGGRWVIRHIQAHKNVPMIECCTAVVSTYLMPFYSSKQMAGILVGLGGAAEYEKLAEMPGQALGGMDAQSMAHLTVIGLVLIGNIAHRVLKNHKGGSA